MLFRSARRGLEGSSKAGALCIVAAYGVFSTRAASPAVVARRHIEPLLKDDQLLPMLPSAVLQPEPSRLGRVFGQQALTLGVVPPLLALELFPASSPTERRCGPSRVMACDLTPLAGIIKSSDTWETPTGGPE